MDGFAEAGFEKRIKDHGVLLADPAKKGIGGIVHSIRKAMK